MAGRARTWSGLRGWTRRPDEIVKEYRFPGFPAAIEFVRRVAEAAEEAFHHPDILVRYDRVTLTLTTHDAGGLTAKDRALARRIDRIASAGAAARPRPRRAGRRPDAAS